MSFQFCCPQGHVLQGDPSQVGQLFQCPMCGSSFLIPPPEMGPVAPGSFFQGVGGWPAANAPMNSYPGQGGMPGMMPLQNMPQMSSVQMPGGPMSAGTYSVPPAQPFAFGPLAVTAPEENRDPAAAEQPQQTPPAAPHDESGKPRFDLGFDPQAKESLPFEIPAQDETAAGEQCAAGSDQGGGSPGQAAFDFRGQAPATAGFTTAPFPTPAFPAPPFPGPSFPAPSMPAATFLPASAGQDFLQSTPAAPAAMKEALPPQAPAKILHIRCPSGHLVKATSDLLGKNGRCPACKKTFELRYEDSIEFQRRTDKLLQREETETARTRVAWALLAAFAAFVGLIALLLALSH